MTTPPQAFATACSTVFTCTAYAWQSQVGGHVLSSVSSHNPNVELLVRPTGGGKSLVRNGVGACLCGITLTVVPLLSLGADQARKINSSVDASTQPISSIHLDELSDHEAKALFATLTSLPHQPSQAVFLFCSPQFLVKPFVQSFLKSIVDPIFASDPSSKFMVYSNRATRIDTVDQRLREYLDSESKYSLRC